jgi:hypothetical protein
VLRITFGTNREEVIGGLRKFYNDVLNFRLSQYGEVFKTIGRDEKCKQNFTLKPIITAASLNI